MMFCKLRLLLVMADDSGVQPEKNENVVYLTLGLVFNIITKTII